MTDHRLVPVEPTPEMVEAAQDAYMPFGDMELAIRMALLASPAVQGERVGYVRRSAIELMTGDGIGVRANIVKEPRYPDCVALYTAPQPAEQQPAAGEEIMVNTPGDVYTLPMQPSGLTSGPRFVVHVPAQQPCPEDVREGAPYDDSAFVSLCREHEIWGTAAAALCAEFWRAGKRVAEQKPAPDVAGLVEALEAVVAYDEEVEDNDGNLMMHYSKMIRKVREALAAHRKQGGES